MFGISLFFLTSCLVSSQKFGFNFSSSPENQPSPTPPILEVTQRFNEIEGSPLTEGLLIVILNAYENGANLNISIESENGIIFRQNATKNVSTEMFPYDSRELLFPYDVNQNIPLSGEYITNVVVSNQDTEIRDHVKTFVLVQGDDVILLPSQSDFDQLLEGGHRLPNSGFTVKINLSGQEQPTEGELIVKIPSGVEAYNPEVKVTTLGGVVFEDAPLVDVSVSRHSATGSPGPINAPGSRLIKFPFSLDEYSDDGRYSLKFRVSVPDDTVITDNSPIAIKVSSSTVKDNTSWLSVEEIPLPPSTPEP